MLDQIETIAADTDDRLIPDRAAALLYRYYRSYRQRFRLITRRAPRRFADRDWAGMMHDAGQRLDTYPSRLAAALETLHDLLGEDAEDSALWGRIRTAYSHVVGDCEDRELAETFFNSVARRVFSTVGVNPDIEFVHPESGARVPCGETPVTRRFSEDGDVSVLANEILAAYDLGIPFADVGREARGIAERFETLLGPPPMGPVHVDMVRVPFFRGKGVYLIGRIIHGQQTVPLAVAALNRGGLAVVDGLITDERGMRLLFSYTHSYFHVDTDSAVEVVRFLRSLLPDKRPAELFISLGYNRHGKTELYRDLISHQTACEEPFDRSPGKPGMVMSVFNMPNDDLVFKMIKDRFAKPKRTTRREVMGKYEFVARRDRAGRLPDTQSFEFLKFDRCCFSDALLEELTRECTESIAVSDADVVLKFVYVERRVVPLDVYLADADEDRACDAVIEFGNAIKDMALSNIFPGDMLLKNFGVTRLGRVIFYDYDEICLLTDCRFRRKPPSRTYEDELSEEPWYHVDENDIFPEEFEHFLGLTGRLRQVFMEHHADLLDAAFWRQAQEAVAAGRLFNVFPYRRLTESG